MPPPKSKPFNNSAWQTHEQQFLARRLRQKGIRTDEIPDTLSQADATELLLHKSTGTNSPMNVYSRSRLDSASLSDTNKHSGGNRTYEFPQKQQSSLSTQELARIRNHASESVMSPSIRTPTKAFPTIRSNNISHTLGTPESNATSQRHQYQYTSGMTDDNHNSTSPYRSHYESSSSIHARNSPSNQIDETSSVDRGSTAHTVQSQRSQYLQALEQQIQEKEARKRAEKEKEANWERKLEREAMEYDYFGRRRGGGGEPVRDESGQPITLLKTLNRDLVTFSPSSAQSHETHSTNHNRRQSAFGMNNNETTSSWNQSNSNDHTSHTPKDQSKYPNQPKYPNESIHHSPSNNQNQSIHGLQSIPNMPREYENRSIHGVNERKQGEYTGRRSSNASQLSHMSRGGTGSIAGLDPTLRTGRRMYTQNANTSSFSLFGNSPVNDNKSIFSSNDNRTASTRPWRRQPANEHLDSKQEHDIHEFDSVGPPAAYSSDRNVSGTNQQDLDQYSPNQARNSITKNYTSPYSVSNALNTEYESSVTRNYKDTNVAYNTPEATELTLKQETRITDLESRLKELETRLENEKKVSEELKKENYELNSETTGLRDKLSAAIDILERYRERYGPLE